MSDKDAKKINRGIQQYAGTMNVGSQAVGDGARAQGGNVNLGYPTDEASIHYLLVTVRQLIQQHQAALPEASNAMATTEILEEELVQNEPNKSTATRLLARLATLVSSVRPVVEVVTELTKAVRAMLGG
jgi:hypothetical protein